LRKGVAHEIILTGEMITADEALRVGLVNRVSSRPNFFWRRKRLPRKLLPMRGRSEIRDGGRGARRGDAAGRRPLPRSRAFWLCCATDDMHEGTRAFLEKRPAKFQGR